MKSIVQNIQEKYEMLKAWFTYSTKPIMYMCFKEEKNIGINAW